MKKQTSRLGDGAEFDLIRRFLAARNRDAGDGAVRVGPGDDCAVLVAGDIALTVDMSVENVHFRRTWLAPEEIGYRAVTAALSDLAAIAAAPVGVLVSLALVDADAGDYAVRVISGAHDAAARVGATVIGGDVTRTGAALVVDVVAVGTAPDPVLRSGARSGDAVFVTGTLGGAAGAVRAWRDGGTPDADAFTAFAAPVARTAEALWLLEHVAPNAMIDLSDGLAGDCAHVAAASDVAIVIEPESIPLHRTLRALAAEDALDLALHGGEDYELCFTAAARAVEPLVTAFTDRFETPLTRIGTVRDGAGVFLRLESGPVRIRRGGFDHFAAGSR